MRIDELIAYFEPALFFINHKRYFKQGLTEAELSTLQKALTDLHVVSSILEEFFEADTQAVKLLNMLCNKGYKILGQSMVIEKSNIGSRNVLIQKIVWTLGKE